jgi:hypothetical protein
MILGTCSIEGQHRDLFNIRTTHKLVQLERNKKKNRNLAFQQMEFLIEEFKSISGTGLQILHIL